MAVPTDQATIKASALQTEKVKIEGVFISGEEPEEFTSGDKTFTVERPYRIRIVDAKGMIVSEDSTTKSIKTPKWEKKFYPTDGGYWNYTRKETLLAVMTILRQMKHEIAVDADLNGEFNINDLEGVEFEAVVTSGDASGSRWINWTLTFQHHNIWTPERENGKTAEPVAEQKEEADNTNSVEEMFGKETEEEKPRAEYVKEALAGTSKLYYKDEEGDRLVATDKQFKDKKVELFFKRGTEFISVDSGLPF